MTYRINLSFDEKRISNLGLGMHIRRCIAQALQYQGVKIPCEINVLVTDNNGIRAINGATRNIDEATDVLSFPAHELVAGELPDNWDGYIEPATGRVLLGDMCLSLERAMEQGREYGHGIKREIGYLTVHSVLHLLGYDHLDEGPMKQQMRRQEETIMAQLLLSR